MKIVFWTALVVLLVVFFGTWPLSILSKIFEWLGIALKWLAKGLDFFKWNGIV